MIKHIITFLLLLASCFCGMAEKNTLRVTSTSDTTTDFYLSNEPVVTMSGNTMIISSSKGAFEFPLDKIKTFTYVELAAGITSPTLTSGVTVRDNCITVDNATRNTVVTISNTAGIVVDTRKIKAGDSATIDLSGLSSGVYIVTVNGESLKIFMQ